MSVGCADEERGCWAMVIVQKVSQRDEVGRSQLRDPARRVAGFGGDAPGVVALEQISALAGGW